MYKLGRECLKNSYNIFEKCSKNTFLIVYCCPFIWCTSWWLLAMVGISHICCHFLRKMSKNRSLFFQGMFIVALPFGVLHGGYWGIVAMVGISHICCHTGKILVECLYEPCDEGGGQEPLKVKYSSRFFVRSAGH